MEDIKPVVEQQKESSGPVMEKIQANLDLIESFQKSVNGHVAPSILESLITRNSVVYACDQLETSDATIQPALLGKVKEIIENVRNKGEESQGLAQTLSAISRDSFLDFGTKEEIDFSIGFLKEWAKEQGHDKLAEACELFIKGDTTGSIKLFEEYSNEARGSSKPQFYGSLKIAGKILERGGDVDGSKELYSQNVEELKTNKMCKETDSRFLSALIKTGRKEEALQILSIGDRFLESAGTNWGVAQVIEFAEKYKVIGEVEKADEFYNLALRLIGSQKASGSLNVFTASDLYDKIGKPELALKELEGVTTKSLYFYKLRLYKKLGGLSADEIEKMESDIVNEAGSLVVLREAEHTYFRRGDYDSAFDAMRLYEKAKKIFTDKQS